MLLLSNHHHHHHHQHPTTTTSTTTTTTSSNTTSSTGRDDGIYLPKRTACLLFTLIFCLIGLQGWTLWSSQGSSSFGQPHYHNNNNNHNHHHASSSSYLSISALRGSEMIMTNKVNHDMNNNNNHQCRWYLAESAIPYSGLGVFTAYGLQKDDMVGFPDICIFVSDGPKHWTHLRSHSFGQGTFFGQYEGQHMNNRAACEGFTTNYNTVPMHLVNTKIVSPLLAITNAGLHRATSPGAGAITHHFGIHGQALDTIPAGSELTIDYGDWEFSPQDIQTFVKPSRPVEWLQRYGWCIDNIDIQISTINNMPHAAAAAAGRGAFARYALSKHQVVAPAPLQVFRNKDDFASTHPEQLFINYCIQPYNSNMLLYPYGAGVNLINHNHKKPNVAWKWPNNDNNNNNNNHMHHHAWLDLSYDEFWNVVTPGGLILEVVALRDIAPGEELVLDYGMEWQQAWDHHVKELWKPVPNATSYVYPAEMDETVPLRTYKEQQTNPYPDNLITMCHTPDWKRKIHRDITWYESKDISWWEGMTYCHIVDRQPSIHGDYQYTVSLIFNWTADHTQLSSYLQDRPLEKQYRDFKVPRRAIRFVEKPYMDDEHLPNVFRHPIGLPKELTPIAWQQQQEEEEEGNE